ncbi:hypothetical protein C1645_297902 [Glomus cerebriforme]|uniref:Uncharacterized protein n=1 Tax=Glomus cerebriforme TaxID=658196 RepID=A0A397STI4_9GLOM|nr:hypothetical protein C1645_297902 [Glomus cerebriforme]
MTRSTYKFGTPWSTGKIVSFPRPRRLFQNSGASRRGSVVGNVFSHLITNSLSSRNSRIEFPFTVTDQENLRIAVQEQTKQPSSQLPTTATTDSTITVTSTDTTVVTPLRKKGSKKFVLSFSSISNSGKGSSTSTRKKTKTNTPTIFLITIEDKHQTLSITRQITDFIEFDQQVCVGAYLVS